MAEENKVQLKIDPASENGVYANAVSVHVSQAEMTIDLGYMLPGFNPATIKVVSRVNLTHQTAESLLDVLGKAIAQAKENQK